MFFYHVVFLLSRILVGVILRFGGQPFSRKAWLDSAASYCNWVLLARLYIPDTVDGIWHADASFHSFATYSVLFVVVDSSCRYIVAQSKQNVRNIYS